MNWVNPFDWPILSLRFDQKVDPSFSTNSKTLINRLTILHQNIFLIIEAIHEAECQLFFAKILKILLLHEEMLLN